MSRTLLVHADARSLRQDNAIAVVPTNAGEGLLPEDATVLEVVVELLDAEKLSDDLSITLAVEVSPDKEAWAFVSGFEWLSYGVAGLTVTDPDGTVRVNPDPRLQVNVVSYRGQYARAVIVRQTTVAHGASLSVF